MVQKDEMKRPKILVTGTAGFIGMHTVLHLMQSGCEIVGLDNLNQYYSVDLKLDRLQHTGIYKKSFAEGESVASIAYPFYKFVKLNLQDKHAILDLFATEKFDYVIHLAAQAGVRFSIVDPDCYIESNVNGFLNILEGCRLNNVRHLVYASSSSVYGLNAELPFAEIQPTEHPASLYAATKKANEMMAHSYSHVFGLPTTGMRFFTVYGPWGRPDMALFLFTRSIINGEPIELFNHGKMLRDFTFVDDVARILADIVYLPPVVNLNWLDNDPGSSNAPYQIFNVGNSNPATLLAYVQAIEECLNKTAIKKFVDLQAGDIVATHSDSSKLESYLGYSPSVPLINGVRKFVDWYKEYYVNTTAYLTLQHAD